jgi:hypothetical protein
MTLLSQLKPEYRALVEKTNTFVEPPASIPQHMRSHMLASLNAFCERRSITAVESQAYQTAAARFTASRPAVKARQTAKKPMTATNVRSIAAAYPELSLEVIARGRRLGYSIDVMNALRLAEITKRLS